MPQISYEDFEQQSLAEGYDEVLVRNWAPGTVVDTHSHPFGVKALVVAGELWLRCGDDTRHLRAGDRFELTPGAEHAERYGPEGASFWAARRHRVA